MRNKPIVHLAFVIVLVLVFTGCNRSGSSRENPITDVDIRKGVEGLTMEFVKNAPPDKVFEGDVDSNLGIFPIALRLKNKGASDIKNGKLVFGFESRYVEAQDDGQDTQEFDIEGKSIFNPNGDEEFITLNAKAKKIGAQSEIRPSTILATACYSYQTVFGESVCIDTDVLGIGLRDSACKVMDLEPKDGQGAPIAITKIETRMLPDADESKVRPHFIIHVENKGNGEVIRQDKVQDSCSNRALDSKDFNRIVIRAFLSDQELDCRINEESAAELRLREKKDFIRCTSESGFDTNRDAFLAPLRIELDYGYTFTISKEIKVEKVLRY